jgi:hypothetical protein
MTQHYSASVMAISAITTSGGCWCLMLFEMLVTLTMLMSFGHVLAMKPLFGLLFPLNLEPMLGRLVPMCALRMAQKLSEKPAILGSALIVPGVPPIVSWRGSCLKFRRP